MNDAPKHEVKTLFSFDGPQIISVKHASEGADEIFVGNLVHGIDEFPKQRFPYVIFKVKTEKLEEFLAGKIDLLSLQLTNSGVFGYDLGTKTILGKIKLQDDHLPAPGFWSNDLDKK